MNIRLLTAAVILLAGYFAFGDFVQASIMSTPESFVANIGRGIGDTITGIATGFGNLIWG
ncbi:MAG: hypothetical protein ACR2O1_08310 [Boseongicola sp.]